MQLQKYPRIREQVTLLRLENGLPVYVCHKPGFQKSFAFFATEYGGMDTRFQVDGTWRDTPAGIAHFLEHKLFDNEDGKDAMQEFSASGASPNAFTSAEMTGYLFSCTQGFEENLKILLNFVTKPYFTNESVQKEQGIIGQEIGMVEDSPTRRVYMQALQAFFHHHPVRERIIGSVESIARITPEVLYDCHSAFYHPGNMVLVIAGDVSAETVASIANVCLQRNDRAAPGRGYGLPEPDVPVSSELVCEMEVAIPLFMLGFKADRPESGEEHLRQRLMGELACSAVFGNSTPLYARLYAEGLISRSYSYGYWSVKEAALLLANGESKDPRAVRAALLAESARIGREGIDPALWSRLKKAAYGTMTQGLNSFENLCVELAQGHFAGADYLRFPDIFDRIEKEDVEALIRRCMTEERMALSVVQPKEEKK